MTFESAFDLYDTVYFVARSASDKFSVYRGLITEITVYDHCSKGPMLRYNVFKIDVYNFGEWVPYMLHRKSVDVVYASLEQALNKLYQKPRKMIVK